MLPPYRRPSLAPAKRGGRRSLRSISLVFGCLAVAAVSGTALLSNAQAEGTVYITGSGVFRPVVQTSPAAPLRFTMPSQAVSPHVLVDRTRALSTEPDAAASGGPTLGDVVRSARWRQGATSTVSSSMATKEEIQSSVGSLMKTPSYGVTISPARPGSGQGRTPSLGSAF